MAMVRPWAKLQARTENLLNALIEYEVRVTFIQKKANNSYPL